MADKTYEIVFAGRLVDGFDPAQARANLGRLFKADPARIEALFAGQRVVVKRGLDEPTARNYQAVLAKAGALVEAVPTAPAPRPSPSAPRRADAPPVAPDYTVAEPGVVLVPPVSVPAPRIATDHLSLAAAGTDLVDRMPVAVPEFDLSAYTLAPAGAPLAEPVEVTPPEYDLSGLALTERA